MQNLEQKFRFEDLAAAEEKAKKLGAVDRGTIHQLDLFFPAAEARLKLRLINGHQSAELISYRRPDGEGPTTSDFLITPIVNPDSLQATLTHALGKPREVSKTRHVYIYKSTRIHIDKVDKVGGFVELESLLTHNSESDAAGELKAIIEALDLTNPTAAAYVDLVGSEGPS